MKVGDIVEFRCPDIFMEEKYRIRGVGLVISRRDSNYADGSTDPIAFEVQWASGEVSWEHKTHLGNL